MLGLGLQNFIVIRLAALGRRIISPTGHTGRPSGEMQIARPCDRTVPNKSAYLLASNSILQPKIASDSYGVHQFSQAIGHDGSRRLGPESSACIQDAGKACTTVYVWWGLQSAEIEFSSCRCNGGGLVVVDPGPGISPLKIIQAATD